MTVVLLCGVMGSGKSSIAKKLVEEEAYVSLNRDSMGGKVAGLVPYLRSALKMGRDVVLDNTFKTIASRKIFIDVCKELGEPISCIWMKTSLVDAQLNVCLRMLDITEGKLLGPEEIKELKHPNIFPPFVQYGYLKEFEPPSLAEGFLSIEEREFVRVWDKKHTKKALILDFDSTIRNCIGGNGKYPVSTNQIEIRNNVKEKIKKYKKDKYIILGVSNQGGIHKGSITYEEADTCFKHTNELLGVNIDYVFCPHQSNPTACWCRKPGVLFGAHFVKKYNLLPSECLFVGDMPSDEAFASNCGFKYVNEAEFFQ